MARITVEDCIDKFPSRFELVLVASQRARKLHSGEQPTVNSDNDKNTVIALREIADSTLTPEEMKENLIQEYQTVTINEEEEEILELQSISQEKDETANSEFQFDEAAVEEETKEHLSSENKEIGEQAAVEEETKEHLSSQNKEIGEQAAVEEETKEHLSSENKEIDEQYEISDDIDENTVSEDILENTQSLEQSS